MASWAVEARGAANELLCRGGNRRRSYYEYNTIYRNDKKNRMQVLSRIRLHQNQGS